MKKPNLHLLFEKSKQARIDILDISYKAGVGHIGSALSIVDILTVLYFEVLQVNTKHPLDPKRDRFILSKGHAASALYSVLCSKGYFSKKTLQSFCQPNSLFGVHPEYNRKFGIECTTGSLGHGLSIGIGMSLALSAQSSKFKVQSFDKALRSRAQVFDSEVFDRESQTESVAQTRGGRETQDKSSKLPRVYVLVSDAELNEGSVWEAVMFASHHSLDNLIVIVDDNGNQALGKTQDVLNLQPIADKFNAFNWETRVVDGHDLAKLSASFLDIPFCAGKPSVIIAKTVSGKGVSFMEGEIEWHYLSITKKQYQQAIREIKNE